MTITAAPGQVVATDPADLWPAFTTHTRADVAVGSVSVLRLVAWCGTPSVHAGHAVIPGTGGQPDPAGAASVLVARVLAVEWRSDLRMYVAIDADFTGCHPVLSEARVIGRQATIHRSAAILSALDTGDSVFRTPLPSDLVVGDLIVVPCSGATLLHDVKIVL